MSIKDTIAAIRKEAGITQEEMARRLYVTSQAVSRWETGETMPGIDMVKLICVTFGVPLERFFDMPMSYYCQCCSMPIPDEEMHGTEADGSKSADFCKYCYDQGDFTAKGMTMDEFEEQVDTAVRGSIKETMITDAIAKEEKISPSDDEYNKQFEEMAESYGYEDVDALKEAAEEDDLKEIALNNLVKDWLVENCIQVAGE